MILKLLVLCAHNVQCDIAVYGSQCLLSPCRVNLALQTSGPEKANVCQPWYGLSHTSLCRLHPKALQGFQ